MKNATNTFCSSFTATKLFFSEKRTDMEKVGHTEHIPDVRPSGRTIILNLCIGRRFRASAGKGTTKARQDTRCFHRTLPAPRCRGAKGRHSPQNNRVTSPDTGRPRKFPSQKAIRETIQVGAMA